MGEEQPLEQEVLRYAEEVDQEIVHLRMAVGDLIDSLDATGAVIDLEAGWGGDGPVIRLCRMISKPLPPRLRTWLESAHIE